MMNVAKDIENIITDHILYFFKVSSNALTVIRILHQKMDFTCQL
jgi:plasmid stabilization system protein ParE